jgi:hypothetical protein
MKRVAIVQSSYIPWKGYFSLIQLVDEFILYDDVQYTHRDWRNRNRIKTPVGTEWLTIPVTIKGHREQRVCDAGIFDPIWAKKHWRAIALRYARAAHFAQIAPLLEPLYASCETEPALSRVNARFIGALCEWLAIPTRLSWSMDYTLAGERTERLVHICRQAGATEYLTGPAARAYLDESLFARAGIRVLWMDYAGYPEHRQLYTPPFVHGVSVLDLLMNEGTAGAARYLAEFRQLAQARFARAAAERPDAAAVAGDAGADAADASQGHAYA